jgi:hypothetical protein
MEGQKNFLAYILSRGLFNKTLYKTTFLELDIIQCKGRKFSAATKQHSNTKRIRLC